MLLRIRGLQSQHRTIRHLWSNSKLIDASYCNDQLVQQSDLQIIEDVVTPEEEQILANECQSILKRRRYERNHWDDVIIGFKEMERSKWSSETNEILIKIRRLLPQKQVYFPAVHVIDLAEDGYIKPHVDSIKFSGSIVAGLSLLSPSIMRFQEENGDSVVEAHLPERSLYIMSGRIRYKYTHEILPDQQIFQHTTKVVRTRRISVIFRNENPTAVI